MRRLDRIAVVAAVALLGLAGLGGAYAYTNIATPYAGADLLPLHTDASSHPNGYGPGGTNNNGGVTYKFWGDNPGVPNMIDGLFTDNKWFQDAGLSSSITANMDLDTPATSWVWWNAHFDNPKAITHFVYRTADHAYDRTPDQFQLRGSTNGTNWVVIYRYDNNAGTSTPWGPVTNQWNTIDDKIAIRFDNGIDFSNAEGYTQIRLEVFSCTQNGTPGISEWQLAGTNVPQRPTVSITFPTNGATVRTNFTITAAASDSDGTVTNVFFYDGLSLLGSATTSSCQHVWNPAPLGSHALTAVAWDNSGQATTSAVVNITVAAANIPPAVSITYPTNGATVSTNFTVTVTASDVDGTVTNVSFYDGASYLGSAPTSACQYVWHAALVGPHTLTAVAWDDKGLATTSSVVNITAANVPPSVVITKPAAGSAHIPGLSIEIECEAADSDGVTGVDFYANGILLGSDNTAPFAYSWSDAGFGSNKLTAVAWDSTGLAATSALVNVTVECGSGHIISLPYSGPDLLDLYTDGGPHQQGDSGGISTPGDGTTNDPAGVTYLKWGGDQNTTAILDGRFNGDKFFMGANLTFTTGENMDTNSPSGNWLWWDAHFKDPMLINHFVIRVADAATSRTPDQFQLRGSNDGVTWTVIYRYDHNGADSSPWGTPLSAILNETAVQFDGAGVDFLASAPYKQIRLEVFSASNGDGVGITEWQLAGVARPVISGAFLIVR